MVFTVEKINVFRTPKIEELLLQEFKKCGYFPNGLKVTALPSDGANNVNFFIEKIVGHQKWFVTVDTEIGSVIIYEIDHLNNFIYEP